MQPSIEGTIKEGKIDTYKNHNLSKINLLITADKVGYEGNIHGPGRCFFNILSRIDRKRFNIVPCILRKEEILKSLPNGKGIEVKFLGHGVLDFFVFFKLVRIIRREKIHVVHLNGYRSSIFGRLARIFTGVPTIMHAHGVSDFYGWKKNNRYSWYQKILDWFLAGFTDRVIAVSNEVKEVYATQRKIDPKKIIVMPNAIPVEKFKSLGIESCRQTKREFGIESDCSVVGTVTRFIEVKGNRYFLEASAKVLEVLPNTYFLLIGDGPLFQQLKEYSQRLKIETRVIFTGFCDDIQRILSILNVKVIPSLSEGCPNTLLEAMAMGKPIVASNVGGIKEVLTDGETGLLVPPQDPQSMAEKIIYLLQNKHERERLGKKARQDSHKYSISLYVRNLERVYEDIAEKKSA